jgi:hypothetical protein
LGPDGLPLAIMLFIQDGVPVVVKDLFAKDIDVDQRRLADV